MSHVSYENTSHVKSMTHYSYSALRRASGSWLVSMRHVPCEGVMFHVKESCSTATHCNTLQHTASHCNEHDALTRETCCMSRSHVPREGVMSHKSHDALRSFALCSRCVSRVEETCLKVRVPCRRDMSQDACPVSTRHVSRE